MQQRGYQDMTLALKPKKGKCEKNKMKRIEMCKFYMARLYRNIFNFVKWVIVSSIVGLVVGSFSTLFAYLLRIVSEEIQILTGDTREGCNSRHSRLHDERRSLPPKSRIERRFESQVAGRSPVCFLVTFCTMQKVTIRSLCREHRGFANLDSAHRSRGLSQNT